MSERKGEKEGEVGMRIGVDVGGTNTDAALMDGERVVGWHKTPTTPEVTAGITTAMRTVLEESKVAAQQIKAVMIGTTHFTNAVVERKRLMQTAAVRLGLPATECLPPMVDWPPDLRDTIGNHKYLVHGGHEFDGREISPIDEDEVREVAKDIKSKGIQAVAISAVFSPVNSSFEERAAEIIQDEIPNVSVSLSHEIGRIGILERENAAILNACLGDLASAIVDSFRKALKDMKIDAPFYLSQNDGTLMGADFAEKYPVLTFASGPTNSMRGAAFLSGAQDAMVVDLGGTTSDVGMLLRGFPREASVAVEISGVRTNFRMPDVYSFGLGGGSLISDDPLKIGPESVGYELTTKGLVFGGSVLTATDLAVAGGLVDIGDTSAVKHLDSTFVGQALDEMQSMVEVAVDRMKTSAEPVPLILVGGGTILVSRQVKGTSEMIKPDHFSVANAIGAAIAQVGGETDRVFALEELGRDEALAQARQEATDKAVAAGAREETVTIVDVEEVPLAYLPSNAVRIRVKAVGDLALLGDG
jgi:N-methylhydantoinase A/oxoprolinase/acetone carboxylase beta subunit